MGKKSTQEEIKRRIGEVSNLLVTGQKRYSIVQYASDNGWNVEPRQVDTYIARAKQLLSEEGNESKAERVMLFGIALRRLNLLFVKCMAVQDYQRAIVAQKEINALLALYEPQVQKHEHTGPDGGAIKTDSAFKIIDYRQTAAPLFAEDEDDS